MQGLNGGNQKGQPLLFSPTFTRLPATPFVLVPKILKTFPVNYSNVIARYSAKGVIAFLPTTKVSLPVLLFFISFLRTTIMHMLFFTLSNSIAAKMAMSDVYIYFLLVYDTVTS